MKTYCIKCSKSIEPTISKENCTETFKGIEVTYILDIAICPICGTEVYAAEFNDSNLQALYDTYRRKENLISHDDVLSIAHKYDISKRNLSQLLGWGEHTFERFCEGYIPSKQYSDTLKDIMNEECFEKKLESCQKYIENNAYAKAKRALKVVKQKYNKIKYAEINLDNCFPNSELQVAA